MGVWVFKEASSAESRAEGMLSVVREVIEELSLKAVSRIDLFFGVIFKKAVAHLIAYLQNGVLFLPLFFVFVTEQYSVRLAVVNYVFRMPVFQCCEARLGESEFGCV